MLISVLICLVALGLAIRVTRSALQSTQRELNTDETPPLWNLIVNPGTVSLAVWTAFLLALINDWTAWIVITLAIIGLVCVAGAIVAQTWLLRRRRLGER